MSLTRVLGDVTSMIKAGRTFSVFTWNVFHPFRRFTPNINARSGLWCRSPGLSQKIPQSENTTTDASSR